MNASRSLAGLIAVVFLAGCGSGGRLRAGVSLDEEWQLGNQMAAQVAQQVRIVNDPQALTYLRSVGARIHAQTPLRDRPFEFEIVNDPGISAFSLPGGHIYVNTGLFASADKANQLAAVVAHEIAHVTERHVIKRIQQDQKAGVIDSIILGRDPVALKQLLASIVTGGAAARFGREDETQADDRGLGFMNAAGFDPHGMLDMFQSLKGLEKSRPNAVQTFFTAHPLPQERIDNIQSRIGKMSKPSGIVDEPEYQAVRRRLGTMASS